jgi:hypothetical protein
MKSWHFFDAKTGYLTGRAYSGPDEMLDANTPPGCAAIEGEFDCLSQRVDLETGEIIDYQPPAPDEFHEWTGKRWVMRADVLQRRQVRAEAEALLISIDGKRSRAFEDLFLSPDQRGADGKLPRERLEKIREEADVQREILRQNTEPAI